MPLQCVVNNLKYINVLVLNKLPTPRTLLRISPEKAGISMRTKLLILVTWVVVEKFRDFVVVQ